MHPVHRGCLCHNHNYAHNLRQALPLPTMLIVVIFISPSSNITPDTFPEVFVKKIIFWNQNVHKIYDYLDVFRQPFLSLDGGFVKPLVTWWIGQFRMANCCTLPKVSRACVIETKGAAHAWRQQLILSVDALRRVICCRTGISSRGRPRLTSDISQVTIKQCSKLHVYMSYRDVAQTEYT